MKMKPKSRLRGSCKIRKWATKGKKVQSGGFISLIIAGLISLGVAAETAATAAAVIAPIATGAAGALGAAAVNKLVGKGRRKIRRVRRIRR